MTYIERAITDVEKFGYEIPRVNDDYGSIDDSRMFLDPAFWSALGQAQGWNEHINSTTHTRQEWHYYWHRFIDHLAEGRTTESFFEEIYKT